MDQSPLNRGAQDIADNAAQSRRQTRSDRLLSLLSRFEQALIITHDNPDPDAIASGWGLMTLLEAKLNLACRFIAGGAVVRAENRRMIELLQPPIEFVDTVEPEATAAIILVDCVPPAVNHVIAQEHMRRPAVVIDHHAPTGARFRTQFRDIRPRVAATATIIAQYLREQHVQPDSHLATALLYGIRTDAAGRTDVSRGDQRAVRWLSQLADFKKLADIETAPLSRAYFADLLLALEDTLTYGDAALCFLPQANGPEIVGEVADLLIRCADVRRVLCAAVVRDDVLLAVRTTEDGGDAAELVRQVVCDIGHGGGHRQRAGGKLSIRRPAPGVPANLQGELRERWLAACGTDSQRGTRLVPPREIAKHL